MHHLELHNLLFMAVGIGGCGYALTRGGAPERIAAATLLGGVVLTALAAPPSTAEFRTPEVGIAFVDLMVFVAFAMLTLRANREWPLWISSMQGIAVLCHLPILFTPDILPEAYVMMQGLWAWPMVMILIVGTWRHRGALRSHGSDPSWRNSSGR